MMRNILSAATLTEIRSKKEAISICLMITWLALAFPLISILFELSRQLNRVKGRWRIMMLQSQYKNLARSFCEQERESRIEAGRLQRIKQVFNAVSARA